MLLRIECLNKSYGIQTVLKDIKVCIKEKSIVGVMGKNGVGKSTFFNCLANIVLTDNDEIYLNDERVNLNSSRWKRIIGFVSDLVPPIEEFTALEYLRFIGTVYGVGDDEVVARSEDLYNFFFDESSLKENLKPLKSFSTGMLKKVQFISSLIHRPKILLLDEPFSGLDTATCAKLIAFLKFYSRGENIIFFTSHDIEHHKVLATHFIIFDNTKLIFDGDIGALNENFGSIEALSKIETGKINFKWL